MVTLILTMYSEVTEMLSLRDLRNLDTHGTEAETTRAQRGHYSIRTQEFLNQHRSKCLTQTECSNYDHSFFSCSQTGYCIKPELVMQHNKVIIESMPNHVWLGYKKESYFEYLSGSQQQCMVTPLSTLESGVASMASAYTACYETDLGL